MDGLLAAFALVCNGIAAGIMLSTVMGIVPLFLTLSYERYVRTVQFLWPRYDPFMPAANTLALLLDAVLAVREGPGAARPLHAAAGVLLAAVMVISVVKNVPINKYVESLDPASPPADWAARDPRLAWRRWNLLRTTLALAAFGINALAAALPTLSP